MSLEFPLTIEIAKLRQFQGNRGQYVSSEEQRNIHGLCVTVDGAFSYTRRLGCCNAPL